MGAGQMTRVRKAARCLNVQFVLFSCRLGRSQETAAKKQNYRQTEGRGKDRNVSLVINDALLSAVFLCLQGRKQRREEERGRGVTLSQTGPPAGIAAG